MTRSYLPDLSELTILADSVGGFIQYFGFKKIHGRIWTHLFLSKQPLAAVELSRRLQVSKTLLSFSISELLEYRVIREAGRGPRRMIYYEANPALENVIFNVLRIREKAMLADIVEKFMPMQRLGMSQLAAADLDADRIEELGELVRNASLALEALLDLAPAETQMAQQFAHVARVLAH